MKIETCAKFVLSLIGIALLTLSGFLFYQRVAFIASADRAEGEVTDLEHVRSSSKNNTDGTWRPRVQFRAPSGAFIEFTSSSSSGTPRYEVGESVGVFFQPSDPRDLLLDDWFELWGGTLIAGLIGAVFTGFGWLVHKVTSQAA